MEKLKTRLYFAVISLTLLSISSALLRVELQRNFYYIAIYLSIVGVFFEYKRLELKKFSIAYPIIAFGIVKLVWFCLHQIDPEGYNRFSDQLNGGKKLVLGGILVFYLTQCRSYLQSVDFKKIMLFIVGVAFISASCYAIWQSLHGAVRAEMGVNRATLSAYIYSALSIFAIYLLYAQNKPTYYIFAALSIILSFVIIILTGTRAAIICHLLITACMTLYYFKKIHFKSIFVTVLVSALAVTILYNRYIHPKIMQTHDEIALYQEGKDNTSLGSRFSMWTVGLNNFAHAPFGQSTKARVDYSTKYVDEHPQHKTAMQFIDVHLHDELIETLSLQGIFGGLALLWFYISIAWVAFKNRNVPLLFTINCMVVYGLSDVLLLSSEAILFYVALIGLCGAMLNERRDNM